MAKEQVNQEKIEERIYWIDNLRAFFIICVVIGHLLKTIYFPGSRFLYFFIYSFHMPAMIFLSGLCAKDRGDVKGLIKRIVLPYMVFETILFVVNYLLYGEGESVYFITPGWIMWYMVSLATWILIIPLFKTKSKKKQILFLAISIFLALFVGYVDQIGEVLSLSRTIVFFPFFLAGFYLKDKKEKKKQKIEILMLATICAVLSIWLIAILCNYVPKIWLYHKQSYNNSVYNIIIRAIILIISSVFTYLLYVITPNKKIGYITYLGKNTITVYLLHGIIIRIFERYREVFSFINPILLTVLLTVIIVLISANPVVEKAWNFFFGKRQAREKTKEMQDIIQT